MENLKKIIKFCYEKVEKADELTKITKIVFDDSDIGYSYGIGFADGFKECASQIGNMVIDLCSGESEKKGEK